MTSVCNLPTSGVCKIGRPALSQDWFVTPSNKAHTATARRIAKRYDATYNEGDGIDLRAADLHIEVETSATIEDGVRRLAACSGRVYVAVTNKEGVSEALRLTAGTNVGVMDPKGNIIKESTVSGGISENA